MLARGWATMSRSFAEVVRAVEAFAARTHGHRLPSLQADDACERALALALHGDRWPSGAQGADVEEQRLYRRIQYRRKRLPDDQRAELDRL